MNQIFPPTKKHPFLNNNLHKQTQQSNEMNILEIKTESPSASNETTVTSNDEKTDISKKDLSKSYRAKISSWHCETCDIYCNSPSQFDVHMISQKHKLMLEDLRDEKLKVKDEPLDFKDFSLDENNESKNVIPNKWV